MQDRSQQAPPKEMKSHNDLKISRLHRVYHTEETLKNALQKGQQLEGEEAKIKMTYDEQIEVRVMLINLELKFDRANIILNFLLTRQGKEPNSQTWKERYQDDVLKNDASACHEFKLLIDDYPKFPQDCFEQFYLEFNVASLEAWFENFKSQVNLDEIYRELEEKISGHLQTNYQKLLQLINQLHEFPNPQDKLGGTYIPISLYRRLLYIVMDNVFNPMDDVKPNQPKQGAKFPAIEKAIEIFRFSHTYLSYIFRHNLELQLNNLPFYPETDKLIVGFIESVEHYLTPPDLPEIITQASGLLLDLAKISTDFITAFDPKDITPHLKLINILHEHIKLLIHNHKIEASVKIGFMLQKKCDALLEKTNDPKSIQEINKMKRTIKKTLLSCGKRNHHKLNNLINLIYHSDPSERERLKQFYYLALLKSRKKLINKYNFTITHFLENFSEAANRERPKHMQELFFNLLMQLLQIAESDLLAPVKLLEIVKIIIAAHNQLRSQAIIKPLRLFASEDDILNSSSSEADELHLLYSGLLLQLKELTIDKIDHAELHKFSQSSLCSELTPITELTMDQFMQTNIQTDLDTLLKFDSLYRIPEPKEEKSSHPSIFRAP